MKSKIFISVLLAVFTLTGIHCSKKDSGGPDGVGDKYYVSYEVNGEKREYTASTIMTAQHKDDYYLYHFTGLKGITDIEGMTMTIITDKSITVPQSFKTETWTSTVTGEQRIRLLLGIHNTDKITYVSFVAPGYNYPAFATITELTSGYVKGTFSGTVTNSSFTGSLEITKGEFYLKRM